MFLLYFLAHKTAVFGDETFGRDSDVEVSREKSWSSKEKF